MADTIHDEAVNSSLGNDHVGHTTGPDITTTDDAGLSVEAPSTRYHGISNETLSLQPDEHDDVEDYAMKIEPPQQPIRSVSIVGKDGLVAAEILSVFPSRAEWEATHEHPVTAWIRRLNAYMLWYSLRPKPDLDAMSDVIAVREEVRQSNAVMSLVSRNDKKDVERNHLEWKQRLPSLKEASEKVPDMTKIMKELNDNYGDYKSAWEWFWKDIKTFPLFSDQVQSRVDILYTHIQLINHLVVGAHSMIEKLKPLFLRHPFWYYWDCETWFGTSWEGVNLPADDYDMLARPVEAVSEREWWIRKAGYKSADIPQHLILTDSRIDGQWVYRRWRNLYGSWEYRWGHRYRGEGREFVEGPDQITWDKTEGSDANDEKDTENGKDPEDEQDEEVTTEDSQGVSTDSHEAESREAAQSDHEDESGRNKIQIRAAP